MEVPAGVHSLSNPGAAARTAHRCQGADSRATCLEEAARKESIAREDKSGSALLLKDLWVFAPYRHCYRCGC